MSFPIHCGHFTEIETDSIILHFNLNGEIIRARGKGMEWTHPHEWLKRRCSNDWVYYSTGGYTGVFEATGEYYLPNLQYPTNNMLGGDPFAGSEVHRIVNQWYTILSEISSNLTDLPEPIHAFLQNSLTNSPEVLARKARNLFSYIDGRVSVLPPDARHVDYNLIPLTVAKGCLYKCKFCRVKNSTPFTTKSKSEIDTQLSQLKEHFNNDLQNYNAVYLGDHDGLMANPDLLHYSIEESYNIFGFKESFLEGNFIFMFGSVTSLQNCSEQFFLKLDKLPGLKYINIGLESADQETLDLLGKPLTAAQIKDTFLLVQDINEKHSNIEVTVNFVHGDGLPEKHYPSMLELIRDTQHHVKPKGTVYLSPLKFGAPSRKRLFEFNRLKVLSRFPTYLYIIQRL
ncbi:MAG: radical SAM domain-containing protein [Deltaproteobacteria bacterium]|nr:radical SAM domain-containing protein [Deltaproteobacteria bacterium]MBW2659387.1 radical SAM domain-containing protein [Deltaproteobacteria bacterium]